MAYLAMFLMMIGMGLIFFNYKSAMGSEVNQEAGFEKITATKILFSFSGRIGRAVFWRYQILYINLMLVSCIALGAAFDKREGLLVGYIIGVFIVIWPSIAVSVKRCHDLNRSGAFVLISLLPLISLWYAPLKCYF